MMIRNKDSNNLLKPASAVEDYFDSLLQESTAEAESVRPVQLKSNLLVLPEIVEEQETFEEEIRAEPIAPRDEVGVEEAPAVTVETVAPFETSAESMVYDYPLQCLMFKVANNLLSLPLISMGSVLPWQEQLTRLPESPDWLLGILQHRERNIRVVDAASVLGIDNRSTEKAYRHVLIFADEDWAITCDDLGDVIRLDEDEVQWSRSDQGVSLGTIRKSLAILVDPLRLLKQLNSQARLNLAVSEKDNPSANENK